MMPMVKIIESTLESASIRIGLHVEIADYLP